MKVSYYSLGCKVNEYESVAIINEFLDHGFELVDFNQPADVYIINTCTVTATSDAKSRKMIRHAIRLNKDAVVAVMGCFAQLNPLAVQDIEGVDIILGTTNRHLLYSLVMDVLKNKKPHFLVEENRKSREYEEIKIKRYNNQTRGFVKIEDGCDNFCSYCAIPYARGRVRSRKPNEVIEEIQTLSLQGMKEIVLTGINTGAYGKDFENYQLPDLLLGIIKKTPNLGRIRISSIEATEVSDYLLTVIKENKQHFCSHFHIPLQGGCNETLKRMNRKYDVEYYSEKIAKIRNIIPDVNITTDILAGFAGETNADFEKSKAFIASLNFGEMHIFPYSRRPNTKAYDFPDQIDEVTKKYRVNELLELNRVKATEYRKQFQNQILEVVVEKNQNGLAFGHSSNYLAVQFRSLTAQSNDLVQVKIDKPNYPISLGKEIIDV